MRGRGLVVAVAMALQLGCGGGALSKVKVDPVEQWLEAGKKVDFAIAETKIMIQKSHGTDLAPDLQMRLAELYSERARYSWLVVYERQSARGDEAKAVESPEARLLKNLAVGTYGRVVREFPNYPRNDEALFLSGHEYRELGDFDKMTETYQKLVSTYPNSQHLLEVYLALGDHAFDTNDAKTAEQYYQKILTAPASPVHALARYKLAWIRISQQDCRAAVTLFETVLHERGTKTASAALLKTQKDLNVMREALVDLAYCYPEVYPDRAPIEYFRSLATSTGDYLAAMRRLAQRYVVKEMQGRAAVAYREVIDNAPGSDDTIEIARRLHNSVVKDNSFDHPAEDAARMVYALDARLADHRVTPAQRATLTQDFELYVRDLATRAQVAAKEKKNEAVLSSVADAYRVYLERFGSAAAAGEIRENWAESLLGAKRYQDAGQAYALVAATAKAGDVRSRSRLNAIAAYQRALDNPSLGHADRVMAWGAVRTLGRAVIGETPADPAVLGIKLGVARSYYEAGDYETAANLFYAVARQYPSTNEGAAAAHLSLDSLRLADNLEGIETLGRRLVADARIASDVRQELKDIVEKAGQRQLAEVTASDTGDRQEQLLALAKRHQGSELGEEALYNSLAVAKSSGDTEKFYALGDEFLATYPNSPKRADVLSGLATVASDGGDFAKAGKYLAAAFEAESQGKGSLDRLYSAATMHAVLGDPAVAAEARTLADRGYPKVDDLLVLLARSGGMAVLETFLDTPSLKSPTASFFRGYAAYTHGDFATARATLTDLPGASTDLVGRARFLRGEMAYTEFRSMGAKDSVAATVDAKVKALGAVTQAFKPVIEGGEVRWAMAGLARVADANAKFAAFLRGIELPANLSEADKASIKGALGGQADEADKRSAEMRANCAKEAKKHELFSEAAKSCLLDQALPDTIPMYPTTQTKGGSEPAAAAPLHASLLKNPKNVSALLKLAEIHLSMGEAGVSLLLLERAEQAAPRSAEVKNLRGLALYALNEPQDTGDALKEALALEPGDAQWHLNMAAHYAAFGHVDRARAELQKAGTPPAAPRGPADHPDVGLLGRLGGDAKHTGGK